MTSFLADAIAYFALALILAVRVCADITSSSDLNCDFSSNCQWRNASSSEDNGEWIIGTQYEADPQHMVIPRKGSEGYFAYTSGFMGRTMALLVSDVASCQIGGGNIKYWYYKTGVESQLEVCTRQPPGSKDIASMKCYDGLSPNFAQQWIFRVVELPPLSQPFELVFRGTFYPPMDVIALTDIVYNSALCDPRYPGSRKKRLTPHLIGIGDWNRYRQSGAYKGETMIIVSEDVDTNGTMSSSTGNEEQTTTKIERTTQYESTSTTTPSWSTTTFEKPTTQAETMIPAVGEDGSTSTSSPPSPTTDPVANFVNLLKQTAPVLPYLPLLIKTLQSVDFREKDVQSVQLPDLSGLLAKDEVRHSPVQASHYYDTSQNYLDYTTTSEPTLLDLAKKFGIIGEGEVLTTVRPMVPATFAETPTTAPFSLRNIYGMQATTARPVLLPTLYPPTLVKNAVVKRKIAAVKKTVEAPPQDSQEEIQKLHSKLFKKNKEVPKERIETTTPQKLLIFKKPTPMESEVATKLTELTKYLPTGAKDDLKMLREIPDLEGLTRGMDLSLVSKPGGFAKLKKQFVNRLMRRTMGLPFDDSSGTTPLPPAIVPIKVTHKMMRERSKKVARRVRKLKH